MEPRPQQPGDPAVTGEKKPEELDVELGGDVESASAPEAEAAEPAETPSRAAAAVEAEELIEVEMKSDREVALEFLSDLVDANGQVDQDLKELAGVAFKYLQEKYGENALSEEKMTDIKTLVSEFPRMISERDKPIFDAHPEIRKSILFALCEPAVNGHLSSAEITSLVSGIELRSKEELTKMSGNESGYEGVIFYDAENHSIIILEDAVTNDGMVGNIKLDFKHLINHEISHGVTESLVFDRMQRGQVNHEMNTANPEFSSDLMRATREIIDAAEELADSQPQHVKTVLKSLKNAERDYEALDPKIKQSKSKESFVAGRRVVAAQEIITDYTAMYMQSDGTLKGFSQKCIEMSRGQDFMAFLKKTLNPENEMTDVEVQGAVAKFNQDLSDGNITLEVLKSQQPEIAKLFETYEVFHKNIGSMVKNREQIRASGDKDEDDMNYEGGYYDGADGFASYDKNSPENKGSNGTWNELEGLAAAFAAEVDITKPLQG